MRGPTSARFPCPVSFVADPAAVPAGPLEQTLPSGRTSRRAVRELALLALLYVGYSAIRVLADDAFAPARERALRILAIEDALALDLETALNAWFLRHDLAGLLSAFHYAAAHYVVTVGVLVWLFLRRREVYVLARRVLVLATVMALGAYLLLPTAPPRFLDGWTDLMVVHSGVGWWGEAASAPEGFGWLTNQLAAFPSMHAGWALWVALAVHQATRHRAARTLAWSHAVLTGVVVVGTGNHWVLDVLVGWAVMIWAWGLVASASGVSPAFDQPRALGQAGALGQPEALDRHRAGDVRVN